MVVGTETLLDRLHDFHRLEVLGIDGLDIYHLLVALLDIDDGAGGVNARRDAEIDNCEADADQCAEHDDARPQFHEPEEMVEVPDGSGHLIVGGVYESYVFHVSGTFQLGSPIC